MSQKHPGEMFSDLDRWLDQLFYVVPVWLWPVLFLTVLALFILWRRRASRQDEGMRELIRMGSRKKITRSSHGPSQKYGQWEIKRDE
jgi:hypothetical protein